MAIKLKHNLPSILMMLFGISLILLIPYQVSGVKVSAMGPRFIPYLVAIIITILSFLTLIDGLVEKKDPVENDETEKEGTKVSYSRVILTFISLALWIILVPLLGFIITTILLIAAVIAIVGEFKVYQIIIIPIIVSLAVYYIFNELLNVILPEGIFF